MAFEVILPKQGWSMDEATFVEWLKDEGQAVRAGELLFSVETNNSTPCCVQCSALHSIESTSRSPTFNSAFGQEMILSNVWPRSSDRKIASSRPRSPRCKPERESP